MIAAFAAVAVPFAGATAQTAPQIDTITVIADRVDRDVPSYAEQLERFLRRPGAETVVSSLDLETQRAANLQDLLAFTPGIFTASENQGTGGLFSIRGSDIATEGPRNGRGIRAYIDGVPLGRTEAGLTTALIDLLATQYTEVYRGPNSLRLGAIVTGGALNFISKTGQNFEGTGARLDVGSFGYWQAGVEQGWRGENLDAYVSVSGSHADGFREQAKSGFGRLSSNLGWAISDDIFSRTYLSVGFTRQELPDALPLDEIRERRREAGPIGSVYDQDANFDYVRLANRTSFNISELGQVQADVYLLATRFDHLPVPFAGIIDNTWKEGGVGLRWSDVRQVLGLQTELVGGFRYNYTDGDFETYQHRDAGRSKGPQIRDEDFRARLIEGYGESAFLLTNNLRLFLGVQAVYTDRKRSQNPLPPEPPAQFFGVFGFQAGQWRPNPGTPTTDDASFDQSFRRINPKLGINIEFAPDWFAFASIARSFEVPTGSDILDVSRVRGRLPGADIPDLVAQRAWTAETGVRGQGENFSLDATIYHMELRNELLTRCADPVTDPGCSERVAFNADRTLHQGVELGASLTAFDDLLAAGDDLRLDLTWNYSRFLFRNDATFGNRSLPVIPRHTLQARLVYSHPRGFFMGPDIRYVDRRNVTYDGTGGDAFVVPSYTLVGARAGWKSADERWQAYIQGSNLTDEVYVTTFSALSTQPTPLFPPPPTLLASPNVRPGDGRAVYFGVNVRL